MLKTEPSGKLVSILNCLLNLGLVATRTGAYAEAERYSQESLELAAQLGIRRSPALL